MKTLFRSFIIITVLFFVQVKVEQIKNDPRVTLYYFDNKSQGYVGISGTAKLVNELSKKRKILEKEMERLLCR